MNINVNKASEIQHVKAVNRVAQDTTQAPAAEKAEAAQAELHTADQGPALGKLGKVISEIKLPAEHNGPVDQIVKEAMAELSWGGRLFPETGELGEIKPYKQRVQEMTEKLKQQLNEVKSGDSVKAKVYKYSDKELQNKIKDLKTEISSINRQLEMGMMDCWGGMANRKNACFAAIEAIQACLNERKESIKAEGPKPTICPPFVKPKLEEFEFLN